MTVRFYRSTDAGAPQNTNAAGALIAILDACLVNGYGSQLPAGWTKPFSGTNKAGYKQGTGSNGFYLRVEDTTTSAAKVRGFEEMTDIDTGVSPFPTYDQQAVSGSTYGYLMKSSNATATEWFLLATEKLFFIMTHNGSYIQLNYFGDFVSNKSGDAFNTIFRFGNDNYNASSSFEIQSNYSSVSYGLYVARQHTQVGSAKILSQLGNYTISTSAGYSGGIPYPSPIDNALHLSPILLGENPGGIRGRLPGLWHVLHDKPFLHKDIISGTGDFYGKTFIAITGGFNRYYQFLLEISDTW